MTLEEAIALARSIQKDLDAGRLTVPYPEDVKAKLEECLIVFSGLPGGSAIVDLIRLLHAPESVEMELPW